MSGTKPAKVDAEDWSKLQSALSAISTPAFGVQPHQLETLQPHHLGNDPKLEEQWAQAAGKHAETYYKLLRITKDKKKLKLTPIDDAIYSHFRATFPSLSIDRLTDSLLKNDRAKALWRPFCMSYEQNQSIKDFNYGCLLRLSSRSDYESNSDNVTIVPKIQFLAIEIARNREGFNDHITATSTPSS